MEPRVPQKRTCMASPTTITPPPAWEIPAPPAARPTGLRRSVIQNCGRRSAHASVGVEMTIARNPLHRSGRAALPHPAPASGDNAEADEGIGVTDTRGWKPPVDVSPHPFPRQMVRLAAALEGPPPEPADSRPEGADAAPVHGNPVVPHVTPNDRAQIGSYRRDGLVQTPPKLELYRPQLRLPSRAHRLPQHRELPLPRLPATVREAEKVEALGSPVAPASPVGRREAAELDEARLVGMQRQPELREPLAQLGEELLRLLPMLESHDEVIGEAHDHDISARLLLPPPLDPEIEHVVQIEVGTVQGGSISPLLANLYLHYVFDLWVQRWRKKQARGDVVVVRFADDFVVGFEHREEAEQFLAELRERFAKFGLTLHPDKTRLIEFGRFAAANRKARGDGKPETFNFLGFTHSCGKTRKGKFTV